MCTSVNRGLEQSSLNRQDTAPGVFKCAVVAGLCLLATCGNVVGRSNVYYNSGLADSKNSLLLTNILRSAKGYVTYYSASGDFSQSVSTSASPSLGVEVDSGIGMPTSQSVTGQLGIGPTSSNNANVSSLETSEFLASMYTPIKQRTLLALIAAQDFTQLNLVVMLTVDTIRIRSQEYTSVINGSAARCASELWKLPAMARSICTVEVNQVRQKVCPVELDGFGLSGSQYVDLRNDPTSMCHFEKFRRFVEALTVLGPLFLEGSNGQPPEISGIQIDVEISKGVTLHLFRAKGTGYRLRSANSTIRYLGEIVRRSYASGDANQYSLTTTDGGNGTILQVFEGQSTDKAAIVAET